MNDILLQKTPAHDIEAEEALISALLIHNKTFWDIDLTPGDFYNNAHRTIYSAIHNLIRSKQPADLVTVSAALNERQELDGIGGAAYLATIADTAPVAVNAKHYAKVIKDCAVKRQITAAASQILEQSLSGGAAEDLLSFAQAEMLKIQTTETEDTIISAKKLAEESLDRIARNVNQDNSGGLKLGFYNFDRLVSVKGSKLILIAGRPAMGKTAFALSVIRNMSHRGYTTGLLSIEMDKEQIADRIFSMETGYNSMRFHLYQGLTEDGLLDIGKGADEVSQWNLFIDDSECSIEDVERKCRKLKKRGCQAIFIDQLSKIKGKRGMSKYEVYSDHCSAIALLKKELRIPIFLLCQINRATEETKTKEPKLSNLKQTGMLEEDADMVFLIHRPGYYDNSDQSETVVNLAKHRQGATYREDRIRFDAKRTLFSACC